MNTPSHVIINLFILGRHQPSQFNLPIIIGSLLPDVAIFWFYFWTKFIKKLPESTIWSETYFSSSWQDIFAIPNSIVLCLIGVVIAHYLQQPFLKIMFISMIIHCLCDLPVHHDDAHRHFVPLTDFRFVSPFSYWDVRYHGKWVALLELLIVSGSSVYLYLIFNSWWAKGLILTNNFLYLIFYWRFYWL